MGHSTEYEMKTQFIVAALMLIANISFGQTDTYDCSFTRDDYETMRSGLNADSIFQQALLEKIMEGDTSAIRVIELLDTPYEHRLTGTRFTEEEICRGIFAYKKSNELKKRFEALDNQLNDLSKISNDSLNMQIHQIRQELDNK